MKTDRETPQQPALPVPGGWRARHSWRRLSQRRGSEYPLRADGQSVRSQLKAKACLVLLSACVGLPVAAQVPVPVYRPLDFIYGDGTANNWKSLGDYQAWFNARAEGPFQECMSRPKQPGWSWSCHRVTITGFDPHRGAPFEMYYNGTPAVNVIRRRDYTHFVRVEGQTAPEIIDKTCTANDNPSCPGLFFVYANPVCPSPTGVTIRTPPAEPNSIYKEVVCVGVIDASDCSPCIVGSPNNNAVPPLIGNPINPSVPEKVHQEVDYVGEGGTLTVARSFRGSPRKWSSAFSRLADFSIAGRGSASPAIDTFWLSANGLVFLELRFEEVPSSAGGEVKVSRPIGSRLIAKEGADGTFNTPDSSSLIRRFPLPDGGFEWHLRSRENRLEVFSGLDGRRLRTVQPNGQGLTFSFPSASRVEAVSILSGRKLLHSVAAGGLMSSVVLPDGQTIEFGLEKGQYSFVRYPDGGKREYLYDEVEFTGGGAHRQSGTLTGTRDELGVRVGTYMYDSQAQGGQIRSTEGAGGVGRFSVSNIGSVSQVTDPVGVSTTLRWVVAGDGYKKLQSISRPAGSGSSASTSSLSFAADGALTSVDDFNGNRTCYASDGSRYLEVVRVQGLAAAAACTVTAAGAALPTGARKTSTQWHPDWRLKTQVAEPGRITTYVYNGQPDPFNGNALASCAPASALLPDGKPIAVLCREVEQATTDANGAAGFGATLQAGVANREQRWTYNQHGQVLTHDGPRTDVADVTTYTYYSDTVFTGADPNAEGHTKGDLASVTNAAGQVTQYTLYDKHGQLLESVDPNGVVSRFSYDLRQRLLTTTVGGQTTRYTYDPAGLLKRVTLPDGSWIGFDHDPAHRQTAVYDHLGNRIEYVLDNAGNRKGETVTDATGALRRQLARSIDALGRVQQTTGRELTQ